MSTPQSFPISFEFFPPKTPVGEEKLKQVRQDLYAARPAFFSVTYGAGGSTQDGTLQQVQAILADGHDAAPHFSCIGASRDSVVLWFKERTYSRDGRNTDSKVAMADYLRWCEDANLTPVAPQTFGFVMRDELGIEKKKSSGTVKYINVGLRPSILRVVSS